MQQNMMDTEFKSLVYKGFPPNHACCDSAWRRLPNGEQCVFFLTGNNGEPQPGNFVALCRSSDEGETWSEHEVVLANSPGAATLSEVVVHNGIITIYVQLHHGRFDHWETCTIQSADSGKSWSEPVPFAPLPRRSMIRSLYRTSWGEWLLPFQYHEVKDDWTSSVMTDGSLEDPWNGVLIGPSPDGPWQESARIQGAVRWAEVNVVELCDSRLVMLSRSQGSGVLLRSESIDHGRSWSDYQRTDIPNPGSKFRLFRLRDGRIALLHNPSGLTSHTNSKRNCAVNRNPLALWISDDDMNSWNYQHIITDFPGMLAYPDGEMDDDERFLHFAFDYNRHDVIYWRVEIPTNL